MGGATRRRVGRASSQAGPGLGIMAIRVRQARQNGDEGESAAHRLASQGEVRRGETVSAETRPKAPRAVER